MFNDSNTDTDSNRAELEQAINDTIDPLMEHDQPESSDIAPSELDIDAARLIESFGKIAATDDHLRE